MSKSKIIKSPLIKDEVCFLDAPELVLACVQVAAGEEDEAVDEQLVQEPVAEDLTQGEEETPVDSKEEAEKLLRNAREEAMEIVKAARQEAEFALADTEQEIERLKKETEEQIQAMKVEGYEAGYQEGLETGRKEAKEEWEEKLAAAEATLAKAENESLEMLKRAEEERVERILSSEEEILKLAFDIAEKIISTELKHSPKSWLGMVGEAVKKVAGATELVIRVSQEDEAFLIQHLKEIRSQLTESPTINLVSDSTLKPGDLLIQTNLGQVDARIRQQIETTFRTLKEEGS